MNEYEISREVLGLSLQIHEKLGPGLLESAYKSCLYYEINSSGLSVEREKAMPLIYKDVKMDCGYRIDLLVEDKFVIEIKSVDSLNDIHFAQTLTYMKLGNYKLGFLMNFNVLRLKDGVKRIINGNL
jgi:GxxExxY protein